MTLTHLLADLGERINDDDGAATHHLLLQHVAALVADIAPGTASAPTDASAPDIVRQRALAAPAPRCCARAPAATQPARSASRPELLPGRADRNRAPHQILSVDRGKAVGG
jgi:hypothetical protein